MRLALALGHVNVDEMLDLVTPEQITEWWAYYTLEPFGEPWQHTALLAAVIQNTTASKRSELTQPADWLPDFNLDSTETKQTKLKDAEQKLAALYGNSGRNSGQRNSPNPETGGGPKA
jgi:hypothetical protein